MTHPPEGQCRKSPSVLSRPTDWLVTFALTLGLALIALTSAASHAQPRMDLSALMGLLAQTKQGQASFVEERHVQGFAAPLTVSGELDFKAPDFFERRALSPARETLRVQGDQLTWTRGNQRRSMGLDSAPEAAAMVAAIRGTLTGDRATLEKHFAVSLQGVASQWQMDLKPRDSAIQSSVRSINVRGSQGVMSSIEVLLANGDRSMMAITPR
jgi:hypothetical protein